jgi:DNA invertase Pin-like site-specific DNA recombinase
MALRGYARVSTNQQTLNIQIDALLSAGVREDRIYKDKASGKNNNREGLQTLLDRAERDDLVICTKLDRLGRNTLEMISIIEELDGRGVDIRFLDEGLPTDKKTRQLVITILSAVAQAERSRILERTNEGRQAAMAAGIKFGRKTHKGTKKASELIRQGASCNEVIEATGISRTTFFRLKRASNDE